MTNYTFQSLFDFTRTTSGTFVGSNGLIQTTPASVNLATWTQQFDNAVWAKGGASVSANSTVAPDGTSTADTLTEDTSTGDHRTFQNISVSNATPYTFSVYVKPNGRSLITLTFVSAGEATYNISTGVVTNTVLGTAEIQAAGNGWYRCIIKFTSATTAYNAQIRLVSTGTTTSYTGDGTSGIFLWGAQLQTGSTATDYTRNNGGVYPARFDYDPATLQPKGILIEEQRVNRTLQSENFTVSPWAAAVSGTSTRVNTNTSLGFMRGTITATSALGGIRQSYSGLTSAQVYALSFYVQSSSTSLIVTLENGSAAFGSAHTVTLNPSNGTAGTPTGYTSVTSTPFGSGYVYTLITAAAGGTLIANFEWRFTNNGDSMLYGRPQFEAGAFATSYIPTVASQVTRTADQCSIVAPLFAPWFNATEGTFAIEADVLAVSLQTVFNANDGSGVNRIAHFAGNTAAQYTVTASSVDQALLQPGTISTNVVYKFASAYAANNFAASLAGGAAATDTSGSVPIGLNKLSIGVSAAGTAGFLNGHIRNVKFFPVRLADFQLQALTA
jgi:hypothetical protein